MIKIHKNNLNSIESSEGFTSKTVNDKRDVILKSKIPKSLEEEQNIVGIVEIKEKVPEPQTNKPIKLLKMEKL